MLVVKKLLAKIVQALTGVQKPQSMYRPLSTNQTSDWTWTAPYTGVLYLSFVSSQRVYITVRWNGAELPHIAIPPANPNALIPYTILLKKGDTVGVYGLSANCYLHGTLTAFIAYGFQN